MNTSKVIHKYDVADFTRFYYYQVYFGTGGTFLINNQIVYGSEKSVLDLKVPERPVYISGGTNLYLLGDIIPYLGPYYYTGTTTPYSAETVNFETEYYIGNLGMGADGCCGHKF